MLLPQAIIRAMIEIFAVTNRGLEELSASEMGGLAGLQVANLAYRRILASYHGHPSRLLGLRTVDDVFLRLATWDGLHHQRSTLARLTQLAGDLDLLPALKTIERVRPLEAAPPFSVTANFVGRRNYSMNEIKQAMAAGIQARYGWRYVEEDESQVNIRVFIEHETAWVGMRLGASPLHRRPYKQDNLPGSLKPSVAAAMLYCAGKAPGDRLLDPFCGAGTILVEACLGGALALGGDSDPQALSAARANAARAGVNPALGRWDARQLPLESASVSRVVTNLPWGRQVEIEEGAGAFYARVCREIERVLAPGGRVVALTNLPQHLAFSRGTLVSRTEISLFGQLPVISVIQIS